jgi:antitoxin (DNA-binding transcriptional repressor) of toxin-antitoxin stability system
MKIASITDAKNRLSALIDGLKGGAPVLIVDRGRPVARLERVTSGAKGDKDGRLAGLVREGIVRPASAPLQRKLFDTEPPRPNKNVSVSAVLIEERRESR